MYMEILQNNGFKIRNQNCQKNYKTNEDIKTCIMRGN